MSGGGRARSGGETARVGGVGGGSAGVEGGIECFGGEDEVPNDLQVDH